MNRKDILIVSALKQEIPVLKKGGIIYSLENYDVLYTGVGKVNATYNLTKVLIDNDFDLVINYGTGASKTYKGLVDCTRFVQRDMDVTPLGFKKGETPFEDEPSMIDFSHIKNPIDKNLICYTGDTFETNISQYDDVVDMESYALAKTCRNLDIDFVSYKYISDDGNADDWEKNCSKGVEVFKKVLEYYDNL
jgi:adenosylhomocysteine nucleosidase